MKKLIGILLVVISAASFGTLAMFGRYAYADGMDIFTVLFLRFGVSAVVMTLVLLIRKEQFPKGKTLAQLIGMGALGYVAGAYLYLAAINYASAGLVALLLYLYPLFVTILSIVVLKEKITQAKIIALTLALIGTAFTVGPAGGQLTGILMSIAGALVYSIYIIVGTGVMKHVSVVQSSTVIFASAGTVYGLLMIFNGAHFPATNSGWLAMLGMILVCTLIPVVTFLGGLERIGPTNAAMLSVLEPVVTVLLAALLFDEKLMPISIIGGAFILISVIIVARSELSKE